MEDNKEHIIPKGCTPFNLQEALAGGKVVTRDGEKVTQLHLFRANDEEYPLIGVVGKQIRSFTTEGSSVGGITTTKDLFMAPKTLDGYTVILQDSYDNIMSSSFSSEEEMEYYLTKTVYKVLAVIDLSQFTEGHGL